MITSACASVYCPRVRGGSVVLTCWRICKFVMRGSGQSVSDSRGWSFELCRVRVEAQRLRVHLLDNKCMRQTQGMLVRARRVGWNLQNLESETLRTRDLAWRNCEELVTKSSVAESEKAGLGTDEEQCEERSRCKPTKEPIQNSLVELRGYSII